VKWQDLEARLIALGKAAGQEGQDNDARRDNTLPYGRLTPPAKPSRRKANVMATCSSYQD